MTTNYAPSQKVKAAAILELRRRAIAQKNEIHSNLQPFGWQTSALADRAFIVLLTGSAGGGKSRVGLEMLHRYMQHNPGATGLMMRKAREWTGKSIVPFMKQSVIGNSKVAELKKSDSLFAYSNGSTLYFGGMKDDDQRESIRSIGGDGGLDIALFEEANAFTEDDLNEIIGRMRGKAGDYRQIILMTNPDAPNHWINQRLILGGQASIHYSGAKDNPYNPPEYVENLNSLTGILYERLVLGRWVQAEGVIYDNFSPEHNISEEAEYNPNLPIIWGADDGYARGDGAGHANYHPRVITLGQETAQGGLNIFHVYYATGELGENTLQNVYALGYPKPDAAYIDSSAVELRQRIWNDNINTISSTHPVSEGIKNVRRLICDGNGVRLLKIHPRCREAINEMQSYRYDPNSTVVQIGEPKPLKLDDHFPDALRYMTWHKRYD